MSVTLSPPMYLQFFTAAGVPAFGYQLFTYIAGTSTKQATWLDSTQTSQNSNPIVLDSQGAAYVWLDPTLTYKFVLALPNDTDPPTGATRSVDGIQSPITSETLTANLIGGALYPRTAAEIAAGVTPTSYGYPPGVVDRYGTNTTPGTTDMSTALTNALLSNAVVTALAATYRFSTATGFTLKGQRIQGAGRHATILQFPSVSGHYALAVQSVSGSYDTSSPGISGCQVLGLSNTTASGGITLQSSDGGGCHGGLFQDVIVGGFQKTTTASISGISQAASAVVTVTTVSGTNPFAVGNTACFSGVVGMTQINGLSATISAIGGSSGAWTFTVPINSSAFTGYASGGTATSPVYGWDLIGSQSNGIYDNLFINCFSGPSSSNAPMVNAGGVRLLTSDAPGQPNRCNNNTWVGGGALFATNDGVYIDYASENTFTGFDREQNGGYGFNIVGVNPDVTVIGGDSENNTSGSFYKGSTSSSVSVIGGNVTEAAAGPGWNLYDHFLPGGTLAGNYGIDNFGNVTIGGTILNFVTANPTWRLNGSSVVNFTTTGLKAAFQGPLSANGASPPAQVTGWGTPTGPGVVNNFSGSAATLVNCSTAIAQIIKDLKAFGIYGA